jgi:putative membrane protein
MLRIIKLTIAALACIAIALFAVSNRGPVTVSFWPLPIAHELPLFGVLLIGVIIGVILGGLALWLASWRFRQEAYRNRRRVVALEAREQLKREQEEQAAVARAKAQAAPGLPSLAAPAS